MSDDWLPCLVVLGIIVGGAYYYNKNKPDIENVGRYQITGSINGTFVIDTTNGGVWHLVLTPKDSGGRGFAFWEKTTPLDVPPTAQKIVKWGDLPDETPRQKLNRLRAMKEQNSNP